MWRASYWPDGPGAVDIVSGDKTLTRVGWVRVPSPRAYYAESDARHMQLLTDAVAAADASVDFSQFDNNGDGTVDALQIVHVGRGQEESGDPDDIWSKAYWGAPMAYADGKSIESFSMVPEYYMDAYMPGDPVRTAQSVGVLAHEIGHTFGLRDLYDYGDDSNGLGDWSIMASGSWLGQHRQGEQPSRPDAYSEYVLGWVRPRLVTTAGTFAMPSVESTFAESVARIEKNGGTSGTEYFLAENRRRIGADADLPGQGLLVYHVDESRFGDPAEAPNLNNNDRTHYAVGIEEAHGGTQSLRVDPSGGNSGDDGDPFPGSADKRRFDISSDPGSAYYGGTTTGIGIRDIGDDGPTIAMTVDLDTVSGDFRIGDGSGYTRSTTVTITNSVVGAVQMSFGNGVSYTPWLPYAGSLVVTLPAGDGRKTVTGRFKGARGGEANIAGIVTLDTSPPPGDITIGGGSVVTTTQVTVVSRFGDAATMRLSVDGGASWDPDWVAYAASMALRLPEGEGTKTVTAEYRDLVGNVLRLARDVRLIGTADLRRVSGPDRYETAVTVSRAHFPTATAVVLATGADFPDALSAAGLCGVYDAPLLLTRLDALPSVVEAEIARLGARDVYVVGGQRAVTESVVTRLKGIVNGSVTRVAGGSRFDTARAIASRVKASGGATSGVFVANGRKFPDALAAAPYAYGRHMPILLTEADALPSATASALAECAPGEVLVVGSERVVSERTAAEIGRRSVPPTRLYGADRYATAKSVAVHALGAGWASPAFLGVATGANFPDALGGGVASGRSGGVMMLTPTQSLDAGVAAYLGDHRLELRRVDIFGGTRAVSGAVVAAIGAHLPK
jgi:M6 family metalloprotease-like protein